MSGKGSRRFIVSTVIKIESRISMLVQHTNRKGKTYYLHQGTTKTGKPKYYFSPIAEGDLVEIVPDGYEVYESPNAQVFLIKELPKVITDDEKAVDEQELKAIDSPKAYKIDVKGEVITVFESNENIRNLWELFGSLAYHSRRETEMRDLLEQSASYSPVMRFILHDEDARTFVPQRYCFRGSVDDWIYIGGPDPLTVVAGKYMPHLGKESFFELY
jgi:hypothetical protein